MPDSQPSQNRTIQDFVTLHNRNALVHAIQAGTDLGIFQALAERQKSIEQLADELNLESQPLIRLMRLLAQTEMVEVFGEDYALSPVARLIPEPYLDFSQPLWQQLVEHVRSGKTAEIEKPEQDYVIQKRSEEWMLTPIALDVAQALDIGKSRRGMRILEIGAGAAVFSATLAHRDPDSVINVLDTPAGLERSRKTIDSIELERQTTFISIDDIRLLDQSQELEEQLFDLILLAGVVHRWPNEHCQRMFHYLHDHVKSDRELAIVDVFPGQPEGETNRAVFELELGLRTTDGQLHDPAFLTQALKESGFGQIQYTHLPAAPHFWGLLLAHSS